MNPVSVFLLSPARGALLVGLVALGACGGGGGGSGSGRPLQAPAARVDLAVAYARLGFEHTSSAVLGISVDGLFQDGLATATGIERRPRLSPDGARLAFVRQRRNGIATSHELFVVPIDRSRDELRLTDDDFEDDAPCWSPDGSRLVYVSDRPATGPQLFAIPAAGGTASPLWNDAAEHADPDWSASAGRIAFARRVPGNRFELWTIAPDGTAPQQLTDGGIGLGDREPCWSPDGSALVFVRWLDATRSVLARVEVANSQVGLLTTPVATARFPRLSPQGDRLFFAGIDPSAGVDTLRLWSARADGSEAMLFAADDRELVTGLDCSSGMPAASTAALAWAPVRLDSAQVSNLLGRRIGGSYDGILGEGGATLSIETTEQDGRQKGGLELTIPLGVDVRRVVAIEVTVRAAVSAIEPTTKLRLTLADYVSERHATHVHATPPGEALLDWTYRAAGARCVDRRGDARVSIVVDKALESVGVLKIDFVGARVLVTTP